MTLDEAIECIESWADEHADERCTSDAERAASARERDAVVSLVRELATARSDDAIKP